MDITFNVLIASDEEVICLCTYFDEVFVERSGCSWLEKEVIRYRWQSADFFFGGGNFGLSRILYS